ncbi:MAG: hypothetical protein ACSHW1_18060 [Yoonia sp.]|uniref:hypothetical protein n=1 Tax=Yoonia sp. TaxID=2212373 RepID=UPI003EF8DDC0
MIKHDSITQDVTTKAQELASDAKSAVQNEAANATNKLRTAATDKMDAAVNAADAAAAEFDAGSIQARAAHQVADQVETLANRLRTTDLNTITHDVSQFARSNPALFIGGAALLGLAATRFLKARDPQRVEYGNAESDPWGSTPAYPTVGGINVPS